MRRPPPLLVYAALAVILTWPAALHPVAAVPGSPRGDLWEGLWTLWLVARRLAAGASPLRAEGLLLGGGSIWPADPLDAVLAAPLTLSLGPAATWTVLVLAHLTFAGVTAHRLGEATGGDGWVAGVLYAAAPITLCHVHNGATEAVGTGWLALAALRLWRLREAPGPRNVVLAALAGAAAAVQCWYWGTDAALFGLVLLVAGGARRALLAAAALAAVLVLPVALLAREATTAPDNVVGIKTERETAIIRRTIGAADPRTFVTPGDWRSPDFRVLARYGEDYVHAPYLGWVALGAAAWAARRRGGGAWWAALAVGATLACGPVLVADGGPVLLPGRRGIPLPGLLADGIPPLSHLSLIWRLAQLSALALAVLASRAPPWVAALALLELRLVSPAAHLPAHADATPSPALAALRDAPDGGVLLWPIAGGRDYLYEQVTHHKPLAASLNFPHSAAARKVWGAMLDHADDGRVAEAAATAGRAAGIRYLLVHVDARAEPDPTDRAVRALEAVARPLADDGRVRVYALWD